VLLLLFVGECSSAPILMICETHLVVDEDDALTRGVVLSLSPLAVVGAGIPAGPAGTALDWPNRTQLRPFVALIEPRPAQRSPPFSFVHDSTGSLRPMSARSRRRSIVTIPTDRAPSTAMSSSPSSGTAPCQTRSPACDLANRALTNHLRRTSWPMITPSLELCSVTA
jgi:hypothetical protein